VAKRSVVEVPEVPEVKYAKEMLIQIPEEGIPKFTFKGQWNAQLIERMMRKGYKELRMSKVRLAQEADRIKRQEVSEEPNVGATLENVEE